MIDSDFKQLSRREGLISGHLVPSCLRDFVPFPELGLNGQKPCEVVVEKMCDRFLQRVLDAVSNITISLRLFRGLGQSAHGNAADVIELVSFGVFQKGMTGTGRRSNAGRCRNHTANENIRRHEEAA